MTEEQRSLFGDLPEKKPQPRVFVIQQQKYNFAPATRFGELRFLLPENAQMLVTPQPITRKLWMELKDFNDNDAILLVGDPVAIGSTVAIAAQVNQGRVKVLKWDNQLRDYFVVQLSFFKPN